MAGNQGGNPFKSFFQGVGDLLGSRAFGAGAALFLGHQENIAQEKFRVESLARFTDAETRLTGANANLLQATEEFSATSLAQGESFFGAIPGRLAGIEEEGRALGSSLIGFQEDRQERLLAEQQGLGDVERSELRRDFANRERFERGRLTGLGLGGSSVGSTVGAGVARQGRRELNVLNEGLRRDQLGLQERLSGDVFAARSSAASLNIGLSQNTLAGENTALQNLFNVRDTFGLAGEREELAGVQRLNQLIADTEFVGPTTGQASALFRSTTQRG